MKHPLVIVESPTKVRTIQKYLGKEFSVMATMGHIIDLPEKDLGIDVENNFTPKYKVVNGKQKIIKQLREAAEKADTIYLAPDPDREGEAIAWHVANNLNAKKFYRITFNEITPKAIKSALENPGEINMNLVNAQQARRLLDRLVGYKISPFLWKTVFKGLSAGRVQSVALRMICEREAEIRAFEPEEYWSIEVDFKHPKRNFKGVVEKENNEKLKITNQLQAERIVSDLKNENFIVSNIKSRLKKRNSPPPFITSTLQQEASRKLGMSPKKTMMIAQQLYEGIDLGRNEPIGLITYMRTDSVRINDDFKNETINYINKNFGNEYSKKKNTAKKQNNKAKVQDAHEAIRPTSLEHDPSKIKSKLSRDQLRLYSMIWKRFIASQMSPALFQSTSVEITAGKYQLKAAGSVLKFDGYLKVYIDEENKKDEKLLPELKEQEKLDPQKYLPEQHFTKPPPRFNEASLIKELEQLGIGRPSTYAQIISTLISRNYVELLEKKMHPTEIGLIVNKILVENFSEIVNIDFTSKMEGNLDKIEQNTEDWINVLSKFYQPFANHLQSLESKRKDIKAKLQEKTDQKCPKCDGNLIIKWGKHGQFLACENFPECKYTQPMPEELEASKTDEKCPQCSSPMMIKRGKFGRFLACSNYPDCKHTAPLSLRISCPEEKCSGELVEKQSRKGKIFYGCSNFPDCKFATWDKPIDQACPQCGFHFLLEKQSKKQKGLIHCLKCGYKEQKSDS